ncbi:unnamed protein product [Strongylus vulgaris]|uniref:Uncharacterized protein n=1 Tax=Strongylus vulgaris TaxID=40348 RepID=A0A3P7J5V1_STRVU|nr:unnamed protein product [Strongylus vulgaris]
MLIRIVDRLSDLLEMDVLWTVWTQRPYVCFGRGTSATRGAAENRNGPFVGVWEDLLGARDARAVTSRNVGTATEV